MGKESWFGGVIQHAIDHTTRGPIERNFAVIWMVLLALSHI
jgi:hypothetical protein